jgi:hypothetical protein
MKFLPRPDKSLLPRVLPEFGNYYFRRVEEAYFFQDFERKKCGIKCFKQ